MNDRSDNNRLGEDRSVEAGQHERVSRTPEENRRAASKAMAARVRAMTAGRRHTPSEILLREGRDER